MKYLIECPINVIFLSTSDVAISSHVSRVREKQTFHPNCAPAMGMYLPKKYKRQGFCSCPNLVAVKLLNGLKARGLTWCTGYES